MSMNGKLEGKKTYLGLIAVLIGMILKDYISEEDFQKLLSNFFEIAGIVLAAYGRYQAKVPLSAEAVAAVETDMAQKWQ